MDKGAAVFGRRAVVVPEPVGWVLPLSRLEWRVVVDEGGVRFVPDQRNGRRVRVLLRGKAARRELRERIVEALGE